MVKPLRTYQPIGLEDLRKIRGYPLSSLMRGRKKIPESPGLYIWRYWPSLADVDKTTFLKMWKRWRDTQPQFEEVLNSSRIAVTVRRTPFGVVSSQTDIFGFKEDSSKAKNLINAIESDAEVRQMLAYTLESLVSAIPPLYIGKADNLQSRLSDHFDEQSSTLMHSIRQSGIITEDVYISFIADPISSNVDESITTALEEIVQRMTNPPLTKRYG